MFGFLSTRRNRLIQAAKDQGFHWHALPPSPGILSYSWIDSGLLILSRLPIVEVQFYTYQATGLIANMLLLTGCLYAKIQTPSGSYVHTITTHA